MTDFAAMRAADLARRQAKRNNGRRGAGESFNVIIDGNVVMTTGSTRDARRRIGTGSGIVTNSKGVVVMAVKGGHE